jgi:Cytochrome c7 and related cytochrome c
MRPELANALAEKLRRVLPRLLLTGFFGLFLLLLVGLWYRWAHIEALPPQPIAFPHTIHAGRLGLPCLYCHPSAAKSIHAGVPPLELCLSCHRSIATERPEIVKLRGYAESAGAVEWVRIHNLPPFVHFSHKRHVRRGIDCFTCHGAVQTMTSVRQVRPLTMGWCLSCHRDKGAPTDCATCHQ